MKYIYSFTLMLAVTFLFSSCSKDIFRPYEDRIEGTWELTGVDKLGYGSSAIAFDGGLFTFYASGKLEYQDGYGGYYEGDWDIRRINTNEGSIKALKVYCVDYGTHDVISEYFDEMYFTGSNSFQAYIYDGPRTYTFYFRRR